MWKATSPLRRPALCVLLPLLLLTVSGCADSPDDDDDASTGTPPPAHYPSIEVSPEGIDFGDVLLGEPADEDLTIRNTGTSDLLLEASLTDSASDQYTLPAYSGPLTVLPGQSTILTVHYLPVETSAADGLLEIVSNDETHPKLELTITGTGIQLDADEDGYPVDQDCDDEAPAVNPGAEELCDGIDNNCDEQIDEDVQSTFYADSDDDGFVDPSRSKLACEKPDGYEANGDAVDCDDTDPAVYPGAPEHCNTKDDDCDGEADEEAVDPDAWYPDGDADGYGATTDATLACTAPEGHVAQSGDCNDADSRYNPGADESDCTDANDYNCDGSTGYADSDGDGFAACRDCDDTNPSANSSATEVCDGADNDCDGQTDEELTSSYYPDTDGDSFGDPSRPTVACSAPDGYVEDNTDCNDQSGAISPAAIETCNDRDDDCDGEIDETDAAGCTLIYPDGDGDTFGGGEGSCECNLPLGYTSKPGDCNDKDFQVNPSITEKCNGRDDDCDGESDEENAQSCSRYYADADVDGWGLGTDYKCLCDVEDAYTATSSGDCNDQDPEMSPGRLETCDGKDNNCNGQIDEGVKTAYYIDADGDGYGATYNTKEACTEPSGYTTQGGDCNDYNAGISPGAAEQCDKVDNNCNGQIDEGLPQVKIYVDLDGDGHGAKGTSGSQACLLDEDGDGTGETAPQGYALVADDCDDSASTTYPGAPELCDGRLNNCSFTVADIQCPTKCAGSWPVSLGGSSGYPAVAQLDSDAEWEVVAQNEGVVRVLEHDGTLKWSKSISVSYSYPALADINYDNTMDVLVGAHGGNYYVFNGTTGDQLAAFSTGTSGGWYNASAFDVDGDGATDIIPMGSAPYKLLLLNRDRTVKQTVDLAPLSGENFHLAPPALYDIDGDGSAEILLGTGSWGCQSSPETCKGRFYVFNTDGSYWNDPTWTDPTRPWFEVTGYPFLYAGEGRWPVVADLDGDGIDEVSQYFTSASSQASSKGFIWDDEGVESALSGKALNTSFPVPVPLTSDWKLEPTGALVNLSSPVVDIDKDGNYEVISVNGEGLVAMKQGKVMDGYPIKLGAGPRVIADINRDGRLDVLFISSSNNSLNCYSMGEGTYDDNRVLAYGTVGSVGRSWYPTLGMDPYEPNDLRDRPFTPQTSTSPVKDSRAFYLGPFKDVYSSGGGWTRRLRALIGEKEDRDFYVQYGGIINVTLDGMAKDYDLYVHQFHPDGTYINTMSSTGTGGTETVTCHSTTSCLFTNESKTFIIEVRGKDPAKDFGPVPYRLTTNWAN